MIIDLSTQIVVIEGTFSDGVVWKGGSSFNPIIRLDGLWYDPTETYSVTMTYDSGSSHDAGGRSAKADALPTADPTDFTDFTESRLYNNLASFVGDSVTFFVGPGGGDWDTVVAVASQVPTFSTHINGAMSALSITPDPLTSPPTPALDGEVDGNPTVVPVVTDGGEVPTAQEMELIIADTEQDRAPTALEIILTGGEPNETITFDVDGFDIWQATTDSVGALWLISVPIPSETAGPGTPAAGTHTLTATGTRVASADFTFERGASLFPQARAADVDPVEIPGRGSKWALQDPYPGGLGTWIMSPSPSTMSEPHLTKTVDVDHTTNPLTGRYHISVADNPVKSWTWTGYSPNELHYRTLEAYAQINRRFYCFDHRGHVWLITILKLDAKPRKRQIEDDGSAQDWAQDYTVTATIYDQVSKVPV